jgi:phospholipid N-methyltransferase
MAGYVIPSPSGYVVELGAGTGAITKALLERGIPPQKIISVDCSTAMSKVLQERYPKLKVLVGNAARLKALLSDHLDWGADSVSYIVSSLPLRSLPKLEVTSITQEIHKVLPQEGRYIQYTYDLRHQMHPALFHFRLLTSSIVWLNFPPARVGVYAR